MQAGRREGEGRVEEHYLSVACQVPEHPKPMIRWVTKVVVAKNRGYWHEVEPCGRHDQQDG